MMLRIGAAVFVLLLCSCDSLHGSHGAAGSPDASVSITPPVTPIIVTLIADTAESGEGSSWVGALKSEPDAAAPAIDASALLIVRSTLVHIEGHDEAVPSKDLSRPAAVPPPRHDPACAKRDDSPLLGCWRQVDGKRYERIDAVPKSVKEIPPVSLTAEEINARLQKSDTIVADYITILPKAFRRMYVGNDAALHYQSVAIERIVDDTFVLAPHKLDDRSTPRLLAISNPAQSFRFGDDEVTTILNEEAGVYQVNVKDSEKILIFGNYDLRWHALDQVMPIDTNWLTKERRLQFSRPLLFVSESEALSRFTKFYFTYTSLLTLLSHEHSVVRTEPDAFTRALAATHHSDGAVPRALAEYFKANGSVTDMTVPVMRTDGTRNRLFFIKADDQKCYFSKRDAWSVRTITPTFIEISPIKAGEGHLICASDPAGRSRQLSYFRHVFINDTPGDTIHLRKANQLDPQWVKFRFSQKFGALDTRFVFEREISLAAADDGGLRVPGVVLSLKPEGYKPRSNEVLHELATLYGEAVHLDNPAHPYLPLANAVFGDDNVFETLSYEFELR